MKTKNESFYVSVIMARPDVARTYKTSLEALVKNL